MTIVRGWCPDAWRPMAAGDGLLLRLRPRLARLSPTDVRLVADIARRHGNGAIELTNRAALQLRGLTEAGWRTALDALVAAGLVDPDPSRERRALLVAPDWRDGDDTHRIARELAARLDALPAMPPKTGFAIDAGPASVLGDAPADFRIERAPGGIILRADGRATGVLLPHGAEAAAAIALAHWFVASGGAASGRMARHAAPLPGWATGGDTPFVATLRPAALPLPFGCADAALFDRLAAVPGFAGIRITPWRSLIVEGVAADDPALPHTDPALDAVDACVGAPACAQASVATRTFAARLAPHVRGTLHVSGCAKGCARRARADVMLTGRDGSFDLAYRARAGDAPVAAGLTPREVVARFEGPAIAP